MADGALTHKAQKKRRPAISHSGLRQPLNVTECLHFGCILQYVQSCSFILVSRSQFE